MKYSLLFFCIFALLVVSGCGESVVKIEGTVTFTDGSPVTMGTVCFDSEKFSFVGHLDENGHYAPGVIQQGKGIPEGQYKVWLAGTVSTTIHRTADGAITGETVKYTVNRQYCSIDTTPLTFEVKKGGPRTFDFTVEKP